jgi:hypothetical protein
MSSQSPGEITGFLGEVRDLKPAAQLKQATGAARRQQDAMLGGFRPRESRPLAVLTMRSDGKLASQCHLTHRDWEG